MTILPAVISDAYLSVKPSGGQLILRPVSLSQLSNMLSNETHDVTSILPMVQLN